MNMFKPKEQLSCCARIMLVSYRKHTLIQPEKQLLSPVESYRFGTVESLWIIQCPDAGKD